jgi:hypothetical protein
MHLKIARALVRSPPTECVSLIAELTREDGEGEPLATGKR